MQNKNKEGNSRLTTSLSANSTLLLTKESEGKLRKPQESVDSVKRFYDVMLKQVTVVSELSKW